MGLDNPKQAKYANSAASKVRKQGLAFMVSIRFSCHKFIILRINYRKNITLLMAKVVKKINKILLGMVKSVFVAVEHKEACRSFAPYIFAIVSQAENTEALT